MERSGGTLNVRCCIVGGGPAGMMLGYLLARFGITVAVLEKHGDFLRDFRGDTVHPSTLQALDHLGLLDDFLALKPSKVRTLGGRIGRDSITLADFSGMSVRTGFIAFMPQWDFLNFLADKAKRYSGFRLLMNTAATGVIDEWGRVTGVRATSPDGPLQIRADVVIATDGRHSTIRESVGLEPKQLGAPMDVLWFRLPRDPSDTGSALGYIGAGAFLVTLNRDTYWQCGYVIPKGSLEALRAQGLDAFRQNIAALAPFFASRVDELRSWDDVKLLEVAVNRLERWYLPGLLFIGDAAHAMSPVGGVGINLAIQDAIATANIMTPSLRRAAPVNEHVLAAVQSRRQWPTVMTQRLQVAIQQRVIANVFAAKAPPTHAPLPLRALLAVPRISRIPARIIGIGFRPERPILYASTPESATDGSSRTSLASHR